MHIINIYNFTCVLHNIKHIIDLLIINTSRVVSHIQSNVCSNTIPMIYVDCITSTL